MKESNAIIVTHNNKQMHTLNTQVTLNPLNIMIIKLSQIDFNLLDKNEWK